MNDRRRYLRRFGAMLAALGIALILLCACHPTSSRLADDTEMRPVIRIGVDKYPPFNYTDTDGTPTGVDIELAQEAFGRLGYDTQFINIPWEDKKTLVEDGTIDCIWSSFTMDGREEEYRWAGPYLMSCQVVAVQTNSSIHTLQDLEDRTLVVQSTTKPESLFLEHTDPRLPQLRALYSMQNRDLIYTTLIKGYADALAAHESAIQQFMKDYSVEYRILEEPLMVARLGVAFAKGRSDGLPEQLTATFAEMLADGTTREIISRYLDNPEHYLIGLEDAEHG